MKTVVAQLTGPAVGAIGVLLVAGPRAPEVIGQMCPGKKMPDVGGVLRTLLFDPENNGKEAAALDDGLVIRTGPESYELHLHGGKAVMESVLAAVRRAGVQVHTAGAGRADCLIASNGTGNGELLIALSRARTMTAARLLTAQKEEGLSAWAKQMLHLLAVPHATGGELWRIQSAAQWVSERSKTLVRLLNPPRVAIVGPPNAGKSTLANALLGRPISITSDIPGTTRDWVDAVTIFVAPGATQAPIEVPVTLVDTAGVRDTGDPLERESIARTLQQAKKADAVIILMDATQPTDPNTGAIQGIEMDVPMVAGMNKSDLLADRATISKMHPQAVFISARERSGLEDLMVAVLRQLDLAAIENSEPFAFSKPLQDTLKQLTRSGTQAEATQLLEVLADGHLSE